jgi:hypothetical protein
MICTMNRVMITFLCFKYKYFGLESVFHVLILVTSLYLGLFSLASSYV